MSTSEKVSICVSTAKKTVVKRRFVPIKIVVNPNRRYIRFEKKLPFETDKVVGVLAVVASKINQIIVIEPPEGDQSQLS